MEMLNCHVFLQHLKHWMFVSQILLFSSSFLYWCFLSALDVLGPPFPNLKACFSNDQWTAALKQQRWLNTEAMMLSIPRWMAERNCLAWKFWTNLYFAQLLSPHYVLYPQRGCTYGNPPPIARWFDICWRNLCVKANLLDPAVSVAANLGGISVLGMEKLPVWEGLCGWSLGWYNWMPVRLPKSDKGLLSASLIEEGSRNCWRLERCR